MSLQRQEEEEKQQKLQKAEVVRQAWLEKKNVNEALSKKMEKAKINEAKRTKEEIENQIKEKSVEKFSKWLDIKKKEERERKQQIKEENQKIQEHQSKRKEVAEHRFQQWLKQAKNRPKSTPHSYGYMAGKVIGEYSFVA